MGNKAGKRASDVEHVAQRSTRIRCRSCGKQVLQHVYDVHEMSCSGARSSQRRQEDGAEEKAGVEDSTIVTAEAMRCWSCKRMVLKTVLEDHLSMCTARIAAKAKRAAAAEAQQRLAQQARARAGKVALSAGPIGENATLIELQSDDRAYGEVAAAFSATCRASIQGIFRVVNTRLQQRYDLLAEHIGEVNAVHGARVRGANEQRMFHGTKYATVPQICELGFNRSYCGQNGVAFGKGVYFARDASYSSGARYSPAHKGVQYMLYCRVLVGETTEGSSSLPAPPPRASGGFILFDSTCNSPSNPSVVVVFQDAQAIPDYVIAFKP